MKRFLLIGLISALCTNAFAEEASVYDKIWSVASPYENDEAKVIQRFDIKGRLQADAFYFD